MQKKHTCLCFILVFTLFHQSLCITEAQDEELYLSDLEMKKYTILEDYEPGVNKNIFGSALIIGGVAYSRGISTHPVAAGIPSEITYDISAYSGKYNLFSVICGKDASTAPGDGNDLAHPCIFYVKVDGKFVSRSGEMIYGDVTEITVNIDNAETITLGVIDCGLFAWLTVDFCNPRLYSGTPVTDPGDNDAKQTAQPISEDCLFLSDIAYSSFTNLEDLEPGYDEDMYGGKIIIADTLYEKGISLHPMPDKNASIIYDISKYSGQYQMFYAVGGVDNHAKDIATFVELEVYGDGVKLKDSGLMAYGDSFIFLADISGVKKLELAAANGGDAAIWDLAAFGNACLVNVRPKSVEVLSYPVKTEYKVAEELNLYGGQFKVTYDYGVETTVDFKPGMASGFDSAKTGKQTITITFMDKTYTYEVTVNSDKSPGVPSGGTDKPSDNKPLIIAIALAVSVMAIVLIIIIKKTWRTAHEK